MNGIINVYKEAGYTSHDVVAKLRGILKQKKIGHTGTLDPQAEGVLPVCLGHATKVCDLLADKDKVYETVMQLGVVTDTQDMTGTVLSRQALSCKEEEIRKAIAGFVGEISQVPPMYSARKVGGKKLYELARKGVEVEREARTVTIHSITIHAISLADATVSMTVHCSKGTYIRTLCHDIGKTLGVGACMARLLRTRVGRFTKETALSLADIQALADTGSVDSCVLPVDVLFSEYPKAVILPEGANALRNGNRLSISQFTAEESGVVMRVYDGDCFLALYSRTEEGDYRPLKMFL